MKKYFERMQEERTPHERRAYAVRMAGIVTAVLFVGWLATLGLRLGAGAGVVAQQNAQNSAQNAAVGGIIPVQQQTGNTLYVASTTNY
jgi:hypothetical protein